MIIASDLNRCLVCLKEPINELTNEHIIPSAFGGILQSDLLCKDCNSSFGSGFEAKAKKDASVRLAIANLKDDLPQLYEKMETGQKRLVKTNVATIPGKYRDGKTKAFKKLDDGSLLQPSENAAQTIKQILKRSNSSEAEIREALHLYEIAKPGESLEIADGLTVVVHEAYDVGPSFENSDQLDELTMLKTAFEFLALAVGSSALKNFPDLTATRNSLLKKERSGDIVVEKFFADREYEPFHGIHLDNSGDYTKVQIRLFGKICYLVHFKRTKVEGCSILYHHDLQDGSDYLQQLK